MKDGHSTWCKECDKQKATKYRNSPEGKKKIKEYQGSERAKRDHLRYRRSSKGRATKKAYDKYYRQTEQGKEVRHKIDKKRRSTKKGQLEDKARLAIRNEIRAGRMPHPTTQACKECGRQAEQYHHHKGYTKKHWLEVIPVCKACHTKIHWY